VGGNQGGEREEKGMKRVGGERRFSEKKDGRRDN